MCTKICLIGSIPDNGTGKCVSKWKFISKSIILKHLKAFLFFQKVKEKQYLYIVGIVWESAVFISRPHEHADDHMLLNYYF
jgi:hypothetical protein